MAGTEHEAPTSPRRLGRRPGASSSRADVLAAASQLFAAEGYTATTIRAIADAAKVDSALVVRFYGNKEQLFAAVMEDLQADLPSLRSVVFDTDRDSRERRLVDAYLGVWESIAAGAAARALVRGAVGAPRATEIIREVLERQLLSTAPEPEMGLTMATLFGVAVTRYILDIGPLAKMPIDELAVLLADRIHLP